MRGSTPDPYHAAWVARLRERMREQRDELLEAPPFAVYGLSAPALRPFALVDHRRDRRGWSYVQLSYGDQLSGSAPLISVRTELRRGRGDRDARLVTVLGAELARARALSGGSDNSTDRPDQPDQPDQPDPQAEPDQPGRSMRSAQLDRSADAPAEPSTGRLVVSGNPHEVRRAAHGGLWAAQLDIQRLTVTVVGREVLPEDVRLVIVDTLVPYWHGRAELAARIAELPYRDRLPDHIRLLGPDPPRRGRTH